ncbi:MAG TPA: hypothetical protein P5552_02515 [Candidatus Competibacteraceae bacterium]|nr:hypothetical protein [Candidatus Competibacteraceae bacterium]
MPLPVRKSTDRVPCKIVFLDKDKLLGMLADLQKLEVVQIIEGRD